MLGVFQEVLSKDPCGNFWNTSMRGDLASWEYLYCFTTQKQAGQKCLHAALLSIHRGCLAFILSHRFFSPFEVNMGGRVFDLAAFICQCDTQHYALKSVREAEDGSFNRRPYTKKPETKEPFEDSGVR